jgi:hypothetical protein
MPDRDLVFFLNMDKLWMSLTYKIPTAPFRPAVNSCIIHITFIEGMTSKRATRIFA